MLYAQQIGLPLKRAQKGYGGPLRAAGSRLTSPRVHFQVGVLPELLDSDQHPSRRKILAFFCAAIGSLRPLAQDEGLDLFPGGAAAERFPQIRSVLRIKTQVPDPVCGQATTVAASAERCGCGGDDAEDGPVGQKEPLRGCGTILHHHRDPAVAPAQRVQDLCPRNHLAPGPLRRPAHIHVFDEAHFSTGPLSELDQVSEFIFVGAAHHDGVYLQRPKACLTGGLDPAEHRCVGVPSS